MSIFESKPQEFRRKLRERTSAGFHRLKAWLRRRAEEFRSVPIVIRRLFVIGVPTIIALIIAAIVFVPMLRRPAATPEAPASETVAEAIDRLDNWTQGSLEPAEVSAVIEEINRELEVATSNRELAELYILKFKTLYNTGDYGQAATVGVEAVERGVLEGQDRFTVYSNLVFVFEQIGDREQRQRFAQLAVEEYENGTVEDSGQMQYYIAVARGLI